MSTCSSTHSGCASKTCSILIGRRLMIYIVRSVGFVAIVLGVAACATGGASAGGPEAVARLERERASSPQSEPVLRSLGIAYYKSGNLNGARTALEQARKLNPRDGTAALYIGLTAEGQNDFATAAAAYSTYVGYGRANRVKHVIESRPPGA